jgi:subtilisin-like proprotein convertase family protein
MIRHLSNTSFLISMITMVALVSLLQAAECSGESKVQPIEPIAEGTSNPNTTIPDDNPAGISDNISISKDIPAERVHIEVDASELSNLNDLEITLTSPKGTESVFLKPHSIGGRIYPQPGAGVRLRQGEETFVGETSKGTWKISIKDLVKGNTGVLKSWTIRIYSTR